MEGLRIEPGASRGLNVARVIVQKQHLPWLETESAQRTGKVLGTRFCMAEIARV